uniref:Uncharacterized protein n=1 Tax=Haptolina brevifila TaxID=156173 RepID=A0A7S2MIV8_9EUKA
MAWTPLIGMLCALHTHQPPLRVSPVSRHSVSTMGLFDDVIGAAKESLREVTVQHVRKRHPKARANTGCQLGSIRTHRFWLTISLKRSRFTSVLSRKPPRRTVLSRPLSESRPSLTAPVARQRSVLMPNWRFCVEHPAS